MSPRASVIVPVHNGAATIHACLVSVLAQDTADFEVLVVDDASTDATREIVRSIPDPRLRLLHLDDNRGPAAARNHAIRAARGDVLLLLDSDCVAQPGWVRLHLAAQREARVVGGAVVGASRSVFGRADGYCSWFSSAPARPRGFVDHHLPTANLSVARAVFERVGLFREGERLYSEDAELCDRARGAGEAILFDPAIAVVHHDRDTLRGYLRHQWIGGVQTLNYRREPGAAYRWLMPRGRVTGALLAVPVATAYTAWLVKEWLAVDRGVVAHAPLIFLGKLAQTAAMAAYSGVPSGAEQAAPRLAPR
jgi:GT2 family glycosyltransferase